MKKLFKFAVLVIAAIGIAHAAIPQGHYHGHLALHERVALGAWPTSQNVIDHRFFCDNQMFDAGR